MLKFVHLGKVVDSGVHVWLIPRQDKVRFGVLSLFRSDFEPDSQLIFECNIACISPTKHTDRKLFRAPCFAILLVLFLYP